MTEPVNSPPLGLPLRPSFRARLRAAWAYLRAAEPARLQATWKALLGVLLAAGATVPEWLDARVAGTIAAVYVLLALWQGEATRRQVYAPANVIRPEATPVVYAPQPDLPPVAAEPPVVLPPLSGDGSGAQRY